MKPTPIHNVERLTIPEDVSIEEAYARYGLEGRRVDVVDDAGQAFGSPDNGEPVAFISREYEYLVAEAAPTSRAGSRWFVCPVSGDWLPVSRGVRYRGRLYSPEAAADLAEENRRRRL